MVSPIFSFMASGMWRGGERGTNLLDTGCPFYDTYEASDDRYVAVAPLEPQFFAELVDRLELDESWVKRRYDREAWKELRSLLAKAFRRRSRDECAETFADSDACVMPDEAAQHSHNRHRASFKDFSGNLMPIVAPKFGTNDG